MYHEHEAKIINNANLSHCHQSGRNNLIYLNLPAVGGLNDRTVLINLCAHITLSKPCKSLYYKLHNYGNSIDCSLDWNSYKFGSPFGMFVDNTTVLPTIPIKYNSSNLKQSLRIRQH